MNNLRIALKQNDITSLNVDAIVNAANSKLDGGGGVDGAIHKAAGPELLEECKKLNGCETGSSKITKAYNLPSKFVIHTVGPVWRGGNSNEAELLKTCYSTSLEIANNYNLSTIAFPNISTGIYGFPKEKAAQIAVDTVKDYLSKNNTPKDIYFVCFDDENYAIYKRLLNN